MGIEHARLFRVIQQLTGVNLGDEKAYLLSTRLGEIMREYTISTFDQVADMLESGNDRIFNNKIVERITTHETRFFRDENIFDALAMQIVPEWMERENITAERLYDISMNLFSVGDETTVFHDLNLGSIDNSLQIWSAGCSTGQEPYSIAMLLEEKIPELSRNTKIIATDIATETIDRASSGVYSEFEVERGLPGGMQKRYFKEVGVKRYQIDEKIRGRVDFLQHNLINDPRPGLFDVVFCRNVSIYFSDEQKTTLFEKLRNSLKPHGVLILGSAESLSGYVEGSIIREFGLARYYQFSNKKISG